jgi:hypothetical protein
MPQSNFIIHPSAWKKNSANFVLTAYSEVGPIVPEEEGWNVVLSGA